ncbi:asparagine synthase-related protein [Natronobacterium texcoconense]|uniref:Asparagine synthase (Glutamine-hydrolysing) n=1 Tax=Natronobacterium texcoconense TaxID=1095778 RepID=A0A1H1GGG9_NATTX|nr:asparagine synthase-related protein [Natronobacterium texcoconense]SDR12402.1 asparagine synthase (glutamine-hydrolysing) [Natronobacterium texcoconense]
MVGICGATGSIHRDIDTTLLPVQTGNVKETFSEGDITVHTAFHKFLAEEQPVRTDDNTLIWLWGDIYGHESPDTYLSKASFAPDDSNATYCGTLYNDFGEEFPEILNGEFCGVMYHADQNTLTLFTDHLSSRPLYYISSSDGIAFSSSITPLAPFSRGFSGDRVAEYMHFRRVFGTRTVFEDVWQVPPASIVQFDAQTGEKLRTETYWEPTYNSTSKPLEDYVDEFAELFSAALEDRMREDGEYGVFLSGGSDSRLFVASSERPITGLHMNDWMNEEAQVAKQVADTSGNEFVLLKREPDHYPSILDTGLQYSNFSGVYTEGHVIGFEDRLCEAVDVTFSGHLSDVLYGRNKIPQYEFRIPGTGEAAEIPIYKDASTEEEVVEILSDKEDYIFGPTYNGTFRSGNPERVPVDRSVEEILANACRIENSGAMLGDIEYNSVEDMLLYNYVYPLTNAWSAFCHYAYVHTHPYRNPFLDRRLVTLQTKIPLKYRLRGEIVNKAIAKLSPELASIPRAGTRTPLDRSFPVRYVWRHWSGVRRLLFSSEPDDHRTHGPWPDKDIVRNEYMDREQRIAGHKERIQSVPGLSWNDVETSNGGTTQLLTLIEHPATELLVENEVSSEA